MNNSKVFLLFVTCILNGFIGYSQIEKEYEDFDYNICKPTYDYSILKPNKYLQAFIANSDGLQDSICFRAYKQIDFNVKMNKGAEKLIIDFTQNNNENIDFNNLPIDFKFCKIDIYDAKPNVITNSLDNGVSMFIYYDNTYNINRISKENIIYNNQYVKMNPRKNNKDINTKGVIAEIEDVKSYFKELKTDSLIMFIKFIGISSFNNDTLYGNCSFMLRKKNIITDSTAINIKTDNGTTFIKTLLPSYLTSTTAKLCAIIDGKAKPSTWFKINNISQRYCLNEPKASGLIFIECDIDCLKPGTKYTYSVNGIIDSNLIQGNTLEFKTFNDDTHLYEENNKAMKDSLLTKAPIIKILPITGLTENSATLNIIINPNDEATNMFYMTLDGSSFGDNSLFNEEQEFHCKLTSLKVNNDYEFMVCAANRLGILVKENISFKTLSEKKTKSENIDTEKNEFNKNWPNEIKTYYSNKKKLEKRINLFDKKKYWLKTDTTYNRIDFNKINDAKSYFERFDKNIENINRRELEAINILSQDLSYSIKVILRKKKYKKDGTFNIRFRDLIDNIEELNYYLNDDGQGSSLNGNNKNDILTCSVSNLSYFNNYEIDSIVNRIYDDCNNGEGRPVKIYSVIIDNKGNKIQKNNLTVNYKYSLVENNPKARIWKFGKLTSPSCEKVFGGKYIFWLTSNFDGENITVSDKIFINLCTYGKKIESFEIREEEIPVNTNKIK
jgi:hypothetical protein